MADIVPPHLFREHGGITPSEIHSTPRTLSRLFQEENQPTRHHGENTIIQGIGGAQTRRYALPARLGINRQAGPRHKALALQLQPRHDIPPFVLPPSRHQVQGNGAASINNTACLRRIVVGGNRGQPSVNSQRRWLFIAIDYRAAARSRACKLRRYAPTLDQQLPQGSLECAAPNTGHPHSRRPLSRDRRPRDHFIEHPDYVVGPAGSALQNLTPVAQTPLYPTVSCVNFQNHAYSPRDFAQTITELSPCHRPYTLIGLEQ